MKKYTAFIVSFLIIQLYSNISFAQTRILCIKAVVDYVHDSQALLNGSVTFGDTVYAKMTYDLGTTDNNVSPSIADYVSYNKAHGFDCTVKGNRFRTDSSAAFFRIETINNFNASDNIAFTSINNRCNRCTHSFEEESLIDWELHDNTQNALSNTNIPTFVDLNSWPASALQIHFSNLVGDSAIDIAANIVSIDTCQPASNGIQDLVATENIKLYPNPFHDNTTFYFPFAINNATASIFNACGQQVKSIKNISGKQLHLQRDALSSGMYFIQVSTASQSFAMIRVLIVD